MANTAVGPPPQGSRPPKAKRPSHSHGGGPDDHPSWHGEEEEEGPIIVPPPQSAHPDPVEGESEEYNEASHNDPGAPEPTKSDSESDEVRFCKITGQVFSKKLKNTF